MNKIVRVQQGESLPFKFDRDGSTIEGYTCTIEVKQYPDDTAIVSRVVPAVEEAWPGFLTGSETTSLSVGLHYLIANIYNVTTDELEQVPVRFSVTKAWI